MPVIDVSRGADDPGVIGYEQFGVDVDQLGDWDTLEKTDVRTATDQHVKIRPGHSLFISRFALRSPLFSYPWIAIALAL